ncbi:4101_t:CDS:2 [Diversispora eburnea]|uniref:4101_t:CDS:1 n=1 Tax=Diversispora eburnea TaxID=1213867 RepID=A0A9N9F0Q0_9GLOM|nr:4101_t:CDS:2 [Diversispora eburnea]
MGKQEVLIIGEIFHATKQLEEMKERYEFKSFDSTREDFITEAITKYENFVAILLAHGAEKLIVKFDKEMLNALSPAINSILVIGDASTIVDVSSATDNGIFVADTTSNLKLNDGIDYTYDYYMSILDNLEFVLITGVPKDPINKLADVEEKAAEKTISYITSAAEKAGDGELLEEMDVSDIKIIAYLNCIEEVNKIIS